MAFTTVDLTPRFGTEIKTDRKTLLSGAYATQIRDLLEERRVTVMRNIGFDNEQQVAFAKTLGAINRGVVRDEGQDGVMTVSLDERENIYAKFHIGTFCWHQDGTYDDEMPLWMILTPRGLAQKGGETELADTHLAYEDLPDSEKAFLGGLQVVHTMAAGYRDIIPNPTAEQLRDWNAFVPRTYPLVCRHRSGRKSLVIGASATQVVGMDLKESDALLNRLNAWAIQPQYVYQHHWKMGDVLLWDNSGAMHRAVPYAADSGRSMRRVTMLGEDTLVAVV